MKPRDIFVSNSNTVLILDLKKPIQNRTFSMSHNRDYDTNATANIILKEILRLYFGVENKDLTIERNKFGKPFLPDQTNAWFNLSHSGTSMAVALSRIGEVGVDIEYHAKNKDYAKIARRFFHDEEVTDLNRFRFNIRRQQSS
ncbi:4'-phosphopantetheinyl transferase family protein [Vibrio mediterranei]